jgi:anthranilate synthase/aminodeoxychorismate synthase-like glutamine amidotransferase
VILLLDNFDSFTYNLVDYLRQLGCQVQVVRNHHTLEEITSTAYEAVVLSPGPEVPEKAGVLMDVVRHYVGRVPVLGICLGHQALGQHFGAELKQAIKPMHGKISRIQVCKEGLFQDLPEQFDVVRYHSWVVDKLPPLLEPMARTAEGELMAFRHRELPVWGLQFHPEAVLTQNGLQMLENWITLNKLKIKHTFIGQ